MFTKFSHPKKNCYCFRHELFFFSKMHCYLFTIQILWVHIINVFFQVINDERVKPTEKLEK